MEKKYIQKAVALKYDRKKDDAPKVTAKGKGKVAEKIIELARKHDIPIKDDHITDILPDPVFPWKRIHHGYHPDQHPACKRSFV